MRGQVAGELRERFLAGIESRIGAVQGGLLVQCGADTALDRGEQPAVSLRGELERADPVVDLGLGGDEGRLGLPGSLAHGGGAEVQRGDQRQHDHGQGERGDHTGRRCEAVQGAQADHQGAD